VAYFLIVLRKSKVEYAYHVHGSQLIIPVALFCLFLNWEGGIIHTSVLEKILLGFLHLYDKTLAVLTDAV
jgi:hypothetical protein